MDLLLIRHGQSGNNLLWEQTGASRGRSPDPGLTELGHRQAAAVAEALAAGVYGPTPTHLYTSLMLRAVQTAAPIADALDLPLIGHREIFEVYGPVVHDGDDVAGARPFPGGTWAELTAVSPRLVPLEESDGSDEHDPDGTGPDGDRAASGWWPGPVEAMDDVPARAARVVAGLIAAHGGTEDVVALVSHGTFGQFVLRELLGIASMTGWLELDNTSVTRLLRVTPAEVPTVAVLVNRMDHMR